MSVGIAICVDHIGLMAPSSQLLIRPLWDGTRRNILCISIKLASVLKVSGLGHQGTIKCAILESRLAEVETQVGNGRKWESERERGIERGGGRESVEKCCFCLQNDLKEP